MARSANLLRQWMLAAAVAAVGIGVALGADPPDKAKKPGKPNALPEVVRSEESDDVDGKTKGPEKVRKPGAKPTLKPSDLDALIEKGLAESKTPASAATSDDEFIRRLYLDLLGKLPTAGSIRQFAASRDPNKRAALIDALLAHPDTAENWARYWRDVISYRSPNENDRQVDYPMLVTWLAGQFAKNRPWDGIATDMITATGRTDENGATVFSLAEESQPVEMAGEVSRIFLGIQIQCAQCHDHPSDPWKRQQFHEFAAFFAGQKRKTVVKQAPGQRPIFEVNASGATHYSMADLKNPEKKVAVSPRFFIGDEPKVSEGVHADARLALAAQYVTSVENPWFAKAFVNRAWYTLMGEGFYNPVDDLGPTRTANAPEVLELLADQWQVSGYDVRWLYRTILNTRAYQRVALSTNTAAGKTPFASNVPSRLRADEIYDNLAHALNLGETPKAPPGPSPAPPKPAAKAQAKAATKEAKAQAALAAGTAGPAMMARAQNKSRDDVTHAFGVDPSMPSADVVSTIPQALYMMNGGLISREVQARPNTMVGELLMAFPENRPAIDALFLKVLGRHPNVKEMNVASHYVGQFPDRREPFEDLAWSLLNTTEFISRR